MKFPDLFSIHITTGYGFCVRCVKQFISVTWKSTYIFCWNQEWTEFGLEVKPLNSFLLVTIIKLTITVSNSIAQIIVLNVLHYEMRVNIRNFYTCTSRNSYTWLAERFNLDDAWIVNVGYKNTSIYNAFITWIGKFCKFVHKQNCSHDVFLLYK
jgi:hypothetical protein